MTAQERAQRWLLEKYGGYLSSDERSLTALLSEVRAEDREQSVEYVESLQREIADSRRRVAALEEQVKALQRLLKAERESR